MTEYSPPATGAHAAEPVANAGRPASAETIGEVFGDLTRNLSTLMRQEVALAKAEAKESAMQAGRGIGMFVGAGVAAFLMLLFLSVALWWAIGNAIGRGWAALIVAAIWLVIGIILFVVGRGQLQRAKGLPQTGDTLQKVPNALKGQEEENR